MYEQLMIRLDNFFQDEGDGGKWRVKGSGQSRGSSGGGRAAAALFRHAEEGAQL